MSRWVFLAVLLLSLVTFLTLVTFCVWRWRDSPRLRLIDLIGLAGFCTAQLVLGFREDWSWSSPETRRGVVIVIGTVPVALFIVWRNRIWRPNRLRTRDDVLQRAQFRLLWLTLGGLLSALVIHLLFHDMPSQRHETLSRSGIITCVVLPIIVGLTIFYDLWMLKRQQPGSDPTAQPQQSTSQLENEQGKCPQCGAKLAADAPQGLCPVCLLKRGLETGSAPGDAGAAPPPTPAELARYFPDLEILELIGRGGMGAVYKARQKQLDRLVALKVLPPRIGEDPAFADRFAREAKALAKLNHPGIVTIHDFGRADGLFFFVMEYVDGVNLRQLLHAGRVSPREALAIVPQICDALQYAHDQGIVHRDIKPENILLDKLGRVKVADFGLAKLVGAAETTPAGGTPVLLATEAGKVMGTPQYMAPEQREHPSDVDHRADIYSLGVVFYQMLTGELPGRQLQPPSKKVVIDVRLDEVVLRALEREPERRYQQASEVKTMVETIAGSAEQPVVDAPTSAGPEARPAEQETYRRKEIDMENTTARATSIRYAGFWRRFAALIIDYMIVSMVVFPLVVLIDLLAPGSVVVKVPFGLFTQERVISSETTEHKHSDGSSTIVEARIVEVTTLGRWKYLYDERIEHIARKKETKRQLLDPQNKAKIQRNASDNILLLVMMTYWVLMEASGVQASLGKRALSIKVVDAHGGRLTIVRALGRNVSKIFSVLTLLIGFMMAGWTKRNQALHDMIARCYVIVE